jgi:dihydrofolate reductase
MRAIAAVDRNWGIGYKGDLLISLPEDQKGTFRAYTLGGTVVYGRKTQETFPGRRLLPGRKNIILSRTLDYQVDGALVMHDIFEVLRYEKNHPEEQIWIIGGEEIYQQFLPYCEEAVITRIDHVFEADAHFPNLDHSPLWDIFALSDVVHTEKGYDFTVYRYQNQNVQIL